MISTRERNLEDKGKIISQIRAIRKGKKGEKKDNSAREAKGTAF